MPRCCAGARCIDPTPFPDRFCPHCQRVCHDGCGIEYPNSEGFVCPDCWDKKRSASKAPIANVNDINNKNNSSSCCSSNNNNKSHNSNNEMDLREATDKEVGDNAGKIAPAPAPSRRGRKKGTTDHIRPPFFVDGVDITVMHPVWRNTAATVPSSGKTVPWWKAFHHYVREDTKPFGCCNLCGLKLALTKTGTTSTLIRHLKHAHMNVYLALQEENIKYRRARGNAKQLGSSQPASEASQASQASAASITRKEAKPAPAMIRREKRPSLKESEALSLKRPRPEAQREAEDECLTALAKYVASTNRPVSDMDHPEFRAMLDAAVEAGRLGANYLHNSTAVEARVSYLAQQAREKLKESLEGKKLVASSHNWISRAKESYSTLSVNWIEDFKLHSAVLSARINGGNCGLPTGTETFTSNLAATLKTWCLAIEQVPYFVTDDSRMLENDAFSKKSIENLGCLDRGLQLIAMVAFQQVLQTDDQDSDKDNNQEGNDNEEAKDRHNATKPKSVNMHLLTKARMLVDYFDSSMRATQSLKQIQRKLEKDRTPLDLVQDVVPRWWSTLAMLDRLFDLQDALALYATKPGFSQKGNSASDNKVTMILPDEWELLEQLRKLLQPLRVAQKTLEGNKYVTSSLVPFIIYAVHSGLEKLVQASCEEPNSSVEAVAKKMLQKMENLYGASVGEGLQHLIEGGHHHIGLNKALLFAHALDPRFKNLGTIGSEDHRSVLWKTILEEMVALGPLNVDACFDQTNSSIKQEGNKSSSDSPFDQFADLFQEDQNAVPVSSGMLPDSRWRRQCELELAAYQAAAAINVRTTQNPLDWWKISSRIYPNLWRLASLYLAIPATAESSGRSFSVKASIATQRRCQLRLGSWEDLNCLHENDWVL